MKNTADLIALANANIPDNTTGLVSPADVRECLTQGADSGLYQQLSSHGWGAAPSALLVASKMQGVI